MKADFHRQPFVPRCGCHCIGCEAGVAVQRAIEAVCRLPKRERDKSVDHFASVVGLFTKAKKVKR